MTAASGAPASASRFRVLRSKNAGPYYLTLDAVCRDQGDFDRVVAGLTPADVAREYCISPSSVTEISSLPSLRAVKISLLRRTPAGHPGCSDCYGMNQEEPLARILAQLLDSAS